MKNLKTNIKYILGIFLVIFLLTSCADVTPIQDCISNNVYGFWGGLWHGMISPFAWIGSLFSDDIAIYAVSNNGGWYDFGFILGIGGLGGSSTRVAKR
jgi:hypothetical protein